MYGFIYRAQNLINQKIYIGQTTQSLNRRIKGHKDKIIRQKSNTHFHNAIRKHGIDNFMWTILCHVDNKKALDKAEIYWIKYYDTIKNGYNHLGGGSNGKHSLIAKRKMSKSHLGKEPWNKGGHFTEKTKLKMSKSRLGKIPWNKGGHHTEKTKEILSRQRLGVEPWNKGLKGAQEAWNKGIKTGSLSEEHRKKIGAAGLGHIVTEETRQKMSISRKRLWADPEMKNKMIEAMQNRSNKS